MSRLKLFYDGTCPLCVKEMAALKRHDHRNVIQIIDIYSNDFVDYPDIDKSAANNVLHALDENKQLLLGLDVTYRAWQLVGKGWMYAPLRWPLVKPFADWFYLLFARNRYRISFWLTGTSRCMNRDCHRK